MMQNKILSIWSNLKDANSNSFLKRLYDSSINPCVYATYHKQTNQYGISITFMSDIKIDIKPYANFKVMNISLKKDSSLNNASMLLIELVNPLELDVFSALCENLINSIADKTKDKEILDITLNQLNKWKILLEKNPNEGLTKQQQQGLYGELFFLKKCIEHSNNKPLMSIVQSWVGPNSELRDFESDNWAVEVKTTSTNAPELIKINGERQLDETLIDKLYLYHVSVEKTHGNTKTLNHMVDEVYTLLSNDVIATEYFKIQLMMAGYLDIHRDLYKDVSYAVRKNNAYQIKGDFPRIKENDLKPGICKVDYCIEVSIIDNYIIAEDVLLSSIL